MGGVTHSVTQLTVRAAVWSHELRWVTALSTLPVSRQPTGISLLRLGPY